MAVLRLAAIFLFMLALFGEVGWGVDWTTRTVAIYVIAGWLCLALSFLPKPPVIP